MKNARSSVCLAAMLLAVSLFADDIGPMQFFYVTKQLFPTHDKVAVFVSKSQFNELEEKIKLSAAQNNLKAHVFIVESTGDIGAALNTIESNSVLVLFESRMLLSNTTKLYILSKCKEKQIAIITSSKSYSDSGALVAVTKEAEKLSLILNLKQNEHLKTVLTQDVIAKIGFNEVIL
jgi:ABC-type uncharacterized transport system substrate-binding protein